MKAKTFWQHAGEILTSRVAYDLLIFYGLQAPPITALYSNNDGRRCLSDKLFSDSTTTTTTGNKAFRLIEIENVIKSRICTIVNEDISSILLTVSGMSSIYVALQLSQQLKVDQHSINIDHIDMVVFGFPYLDTIKMMKRKELNPG